MGGGAPQAIGTFSHIFHVDLHASAWGLRNSFHQLSDGDIQVWLPTCMRWVHSHFMPTACSLTHIVANFVDMDAAKTSRMTASEQALVRRLHFEQGKTRSDISRLLERSLSSISRLLAQKKAPRRMGRPRKLTEATIDRIVATLEKMVDTTDGDDEVTLHMLMRRCRAKASPRTVSNALHRRGYRFRNMRQKPILTPADIEERYRWARRYRSKSSAWWLRAVHVHLDNKAFKVATTQAGRKLLAKRMVRGVYRKKGKSLRSGHVKPNSKLHLGLGGKGVLKAGGVGNGMVLVWHTIDGTWSGETAASFYKDVVRPSLDEQYGKRKYCILEDNDPTGNQSNKGKAAKRTAKLELLALPKRSPDLNVMDYAVWTAVERRMRTQEKKWPANKKETRADFVCRLDRVARSLPKEFIDKSIGDLQRRCERLYAARGGLFEEGGRRRRPL